MSVKALLKRYAYAVSPQLTVAIFTSRPRRRSHLIETRTEILPTIHLASFTDEEMRRASTEVREAQQWLVLTPLAHAVHG